MLPLCIGYIIKGQSFPHCSYIELETRYHDDFCSCKMRKNKLFFPLKYGSRMMAYKINLGNYTGKDARWIFIHTVNTKCEKS